MNRVGGNERWDDWWVGGWVAGRKEEGLIRIEEQWRGGVGVLGKEGGREVARGRGRGREWLFGGGEKVEGQ